MRNCARVVVEKGDYIYLLKRRKKISGSISEYFVIPGGGIEDGETPEQAAIREIKEELDVDIELEKMFYEEFNEKTQRIEKFYFAKIKRGTPKLGSGEEFINQTIDNEKGTYEVYKLRKSEIAAYDIKPISVKDILTGIYA